VEDKVLRDDYYIIKVKWFGGFTHNVPCRGYNLKSLLRFHDSLDYADTYSYETTTKQQYEKLIYGEEEWESLPAVDTKLKKSKTPSTSQAKDGQSTKADGKKSLSTKVSAKTASKTTRKPTQYVTPKRKNSTG
jgi:hypothetical protein